MSELTIQEKIDYIYKKLKTEDRNRKIYLFFKWGTRFLVILFILFFYYFGFELIGNKISKDIEKNFDFKKEYFLNKKDEFIYKAKKKINNFYKKDEDIKEKIEY